MRRAAILSVVLAAAAATDAPASGRAVACRPATGSARQLVTVDAPAARSTAAALRLWRRSGDCWLPLAGPWTARVGRNGLSPRHREGDGTTPTGTYGFGATVYGVAPDPGVRFRYRRLACGDWWDEDASSPTYNRFRHVRCGAQPPFGGDSEALWLQATAYRHFAVLAYNTGPVVRGRGSAIFLHADTGRATNGCVSLRLGELVRTLRWLDPRARPLIRIAVTG